MLRNRVVLFLVSLLLTLVALAALSSQACARGAGDQSYHYDYIHVSIDVRPNGDLEVVETLALHYLDGIFTYGYRDIPLSRMNAIEDLWVEDNRQRLGPDQLWLEHRGDSLRVTWHHAPTERTTRVITLHYVARGALRIYPEGDQVWWKAVFAERDVPVDSSWVTVHLPADVPPEQLRVASYGVEAEQRLMNARTVYFRTGQVAPGQELEVRVQFPHGLVRAQPQAWQLEVDRQTAYDAQVRPLVNLAIIVVSLLGVLMVGLVLLITWYRQGRETSHPESAEYSTEPPSDLAPGLVRVLVSGRADARAVAATLVDLARRGIIELREQWIGGPSAPDCGRDYTVALKVRGAALAPFEQRLLDWVLRGYSERRISELEGRGRQMLHELAELLCAESTRLGHFDRNPERTRMLYTVPGQLVVLLGVALAVLASGLLRWYPHAGVQVIAHLVVQGLRRYTDMALWPSVALILGGGLAVVRGLRAPRRTDLGVAEAARWRAFGRYLRELREFGDQQEAQELFDRYLPYAIALGAERQWVDRMVALCAVAPDWYVPLVPLAAAGAVRSVAIGGEGLAPPTLEGLSTGLAGGLQSLSDSLIATLNTTASWLSSSGADLDSASGQGAWRGGGGGGGGGGGAG